MTMLRKVIATAVTGIITAMLLSKGEKGMLKGCGSDSEAMTIGEGCIGLFIGAKCVQNFPVTSDKLW